jgi:hypothetical protein
VIYLPVLPPERLMTLEAQATAWPPSTAALGALATLRMRYSWAASIHLTAATT